MAESEISAGRGEDGEIGTSVGDAPDVCLERLRVRPHAAVSKGLERNGNEETNDGRVAFCALLEEATATFRVDAVRPLQSR